MAVIVEFEGTRFEFFTEVSITLEYAAINSKFTIKGLRDFKNPLHTRLFKPLSYNTVVIYSKKGEKLLTGTILNSVTTDQSEDALSVLSGYSKTGVLNDCKIPRELYPLEFNGLSLRVIAETLCKPFGISVVITNDGGVADEAINEVTADQNQTPAGFITEIAKQRNLIVSHDADGNLLITKPNTDRRSTATYVSGIPAVSIKLNVNGSKMNSEITTMKQAQIDTDNASESTAKNSLVKVYRPSTSQQSVGTDNTSEDAARNEISSQLKGISVTILSDRWEWLNAFKRNKKETVKPNNIIDVESEKCYLKRRTAFFVNRVVLKENASERSAVLTGILPEVFNNNDPKIRFE
jgi:prophage tail gpP-like protein